jgi:hypothetical protein
MTEDQKMTNCFKRGRIVIITLRKGQQCLIDDEDYVKVKNYKFSYYGGNKRYSQYEVRSCIKLTNGKRKIISLASLIIDIPKGKYVSYLNKNTLDNRKENLGIRSSHQTRGSAKKTQMYGGNLTSSRFKGVIKNKWRNDKFCARIQPRKDEERRFIDLGCYDLEIAAAFAYNKAAKEYFGEYARLNPILKCYCLHYPESHSIDMKTCSMYQCKCDGYKELSA